MGYLNISLVFLDLEGIQEKLSGLGFWGLGFKFSLYFLGLEGNKGSCYRL